MAAAPEDPTPTDDDDGAAATQALIGQLAAMQRAQPPVESLDQLPALDSELQRSAADDAAELAPGNANSLRFVDNIFRTLHHNFEISAAMAPNFAQLRVPIARLALQEPQFFTEPGHPAHGVLEALSALGSTDNNVSPALHAKISTIVQRLVDDYDGDNGSFERAGAELASLKDQQEQVLDRNVERVVSSLQGSQRLLDAQREVEQHLTGEMGEEDVPCPLLELLDSGWRAALVQIALREGTGGIAWREEMSLLRALLAQLQDADGEQVPAPERREMQLRLRALGRRLTAANPGAVAHEQPLEQLREAIGDGEQPPGESYRAPDLPGRPPSLARVENLPRLRRWLQRVRDLQPGTRLRYRDQEGRRRQMRLVWISDDRNRYAFVNERGQKIAELSAVQLARQLGRGARPAESNDHLSVLDQSIYETLESAQRSLSFEHNRDQLTQLINADALRQQLHRTVRHAQGHDAEHAFILLDIDRFSLVNEVFDETTGDEVLAQFAQLLAQLNDRRALTARLQEDEFGILLTYRSADEARHIADQIRDDSAASSLNIGEEGVTFTVSLGVAPILQATPDAETVLQQARTALDLAKAQGRNQAMVYTLEQQEVLEYKRERLASRQRLEEAISLDRLALRGQPIVQGRLDGSEHVRHHYEILLALRTADGKLESPVEFIATAERFGYMTLVDRWVVREVFSWMSQLMDRQKVVPELSINLSGASLTHTDFLDYLLEQISEFGVGTNQLCFEITETGAVGSLAKAADFVRTLKNLGCKFSLDDFGTGLASYSYLKELPVDYVKIDGAFVTRIHENRTDYAMAKSINDLAHFLGQKTIAECVEVLDTLPTLREIGVDYLQGWGVGAPQLLEQITEELDNLET